MSGVASNPLWPQFDPRVMREYGGKWVVAVNGEVIAAEDDPEGARAAATDALRRRGEVLPRRLVAVAVCRPEDARLP